MVQKNLCKHGHSQEDQKLVFKTNYRLMQVKSFAEHSAILLTIIKLRFVIKIFILTIWQVLLYFIILWRRVREWNNAMQ